MSFSADNCRVDSLHESLKLPIDVLRLDLLHPVVSGNKWFKLKEYLRLAEMEKKREVVTFGGPYSNHLVATAAAANNNGLQSIGLIRGERPSLLSHTLLDAERFGMKLHFLSRTEYAQKIIPAAITDLIERENFIVVPEGGSGIPGMKGAKDILKNVDLENYSHIVTAVGTGTTLAGMVAASPPGIKLIGIPVLKGALSLQNDINALLLDEKQGCFTLIDKYHFGGYAKKTAELIAFMNDFYEATSIPSDFVYTGKTFYAVLDLFRQRYFSEKDKVLVIHTGGLQGNRSLPKGTLIFG